MARQPRLHQPGGVYHVMLRGNGGQAIFLQEEDRYRLYLLLQEGVERFDHRVHALCLMTNHIHLAIQVGALPLSKIMQNVAFRYTRWINRRDRRTGHLFQGRYKAVLVDADSYLLELVRYIHLNPVRAGMVRTPEDYPWSGHRAYLGAETLPWLTTDWVLGHFGEQRSDARQRYAEFVQGGIEEGHREDFHRGGDDPRVLGDDKFTERVLAGLGEGDMSTPTTEALIELVCREYHVEEAELAAKGRSRKLAEARAMVAWLAIEAASDSLTNIARRFGRQSNTLSEAVQNLRYRARQSTELACRMHKMTSELGI